MNPWFICRPAFISNEQEGVNYIAVELSPSLLKDMRKARDALNAVEKLLGKQNASIHIYNYCPYWLENFPEELSGRTIPDVDEFDDWTRIQEPPLIEQLAESHDEEEEHEDDLDAIDDALHRNQIRTNNERLVITGHDFLYFECTLKHSDVTVESPSLSSEMLEILNASYPKDM